MCPPYTEEFKSAPSYRPKTREKRYLNRVVKGQPLAMNHALFLPTTLEMVRNIVHDGEQRRYVEIDVKMLTGADDATVTERIDRMLELYERMPYSFVDQISEGEMHRHLTEMNCGISPNQAAVALYGMDVELCDYDAPFDQLSWALDWFQKNDYLPVLESNQVIDAEHGSHCIMIRLIESLADTILINQNGSHHTGRLDQLKAWPNVGHTVLEQDEFGPLRCGLVTNKGTIAYG